MKSSINRSSRNVNANPHYPKEKAWCGKFESRIDSQDEMSTSINKKLADSNKFQPKNQENRNE